MHKHLAVFVFVILVFPSAISQYDEEIENSDVISLGDDTFDEVIHSNEFVFVQFYAPWCGHCKRLMPEYGKVATSLKSEGSNVIIAKVDVTQHAVVSNKYGIRGYPTLKLFKNANSIDYEGGRSSQELIQWLKKKSSPATLHITSQESFNVLVAQPGLKIVAYFAANSPTMSKWSTAASSGRLEDFVLTHVTDPSLYGEYSVDSAVVLKLGEEPVVYRGNFDTDSIVSWAQKEGYPLIDELAQKIWQRSQSTGFPLLAVFISDRNEENMHLVRSIAEKSKGTVLTSYSTSVSLAERWGTGKGFPTAILIQWNGQEPKMTIFDVEAEVFNNESGEDFITKTLQGIYKGYRTSDPIPETNDDPVKIIVGKNFDEIVLDTSKDVFVEFYTHWCGHCKKLAPVWDELGEAFDDIDSIVIAKMDATTNAPPDSIDIKGFPTLIFFTANNKVGIPYLGDRDLQSLKKFVLQHTTHPIIKEEL